MDNNTKYYTKEEIIAALQEHFDEDTGNDNLLAIEETTGKITSFKSIEDISLNLINIFYSYNNIPQYIKDIYEEYLKERNYKWNAPIVLLYYFFFFNQNMLPNNGKEKDTE
jgi:hypothetical protein